MQVADFFSDGFGKLKKKPAVIVTNISIWLVIWITVTLITSGLAPWYTAATFSLLNIGLLIVAYYLLIYLVGILLEKKRYTVFVFLFLLIFTVITYLRYYSNSVYLVLISSNAFPISEKIKYLFSGVSTFMVMAFGLFYALLINRSRKEKEYQEVIFVQQQQQLEFLKAQMSPHFLFNTLNNIYSLTIDKAPKASEMLLLLSDILRYAIYESKNQQVSLFNEINQIAKLIDLYQLKSESRLAIQFEHSITSPEIYIEPMILIPLVENCFKHGNIQSAADAFIAIRLVEKNGIINFQLSNSKENRNHKKNQPGGIGLKNIQQRLSLRYPNRHSLECREEAISYFLNLEIDTTHG